ncbi:TetR/AcrR family transcriptional regulator [Nocardia anaemiae]|uniref:TetR/AcrR family transcriptional regulator n=1 Tax=Nocardia anaemiae TaxID=263910 RepID=UPI0007A5272E|nr:TetR/AcrR family transcriptional regulator [Nocardia anaemiae]
MSGRVTVDDEIDPGSALRARSVHATDAVESKDSNSLGTRARSVLRTRAALIQSGRQALGNGMAARLGIADLARNAGVATGSFYNHFGSKEELFAAVTAEVVEDLAGILDNAAAGIDEPAELVRAQVRALAAIGVTDPETAAIVLAARYRILENREIHSRLSSGIRAGISAGCFRVHDLGAVLDLTGEVVLAVLRTSRRNPAAVTAEWIETLAQQVLFALGHPIAKD